MKGRPILFSAPMVRAILDGTKTQTRRVVKRPKHVPLDYVLNPRLLVDAFKTWWGEPNGLSVGFSQCCPFGKPGDRLWVRETHVAFDERTPENTGEVFYRADDEYERLNFRWTPSIFMPRRHSRITLEVAGVRVERLQDISEADAQAEGVARDTEPCDHPRHSCAEVGCLGPTHRASFGLLWMEINGANSWRENPWVWVVEFKLATP